MGFGNLATYHMLSASKSTLFIHPVGYRKANEKHYIRSFLGKITIHLLLYNSKLFLSLVIIHYLSCRVSLELHLEKRYHFSFRPMKVFPSISDIPTNYFLKELSMYVFYLANFSNETIHSQKLPFISTPCVFYSIICYGTLLILIEHSN